MSPLKILFSLLALIFLGLTTNAQDEISWLNDYTGEMKIGNDTYRYKFMNVDGNDCKIEIEELLTDKRGRTESRSWIFYLSDIDPAAVSFDSKGKSIEVTMESRLSQKFISYYEEGEFEEYTEEIELTMNDVSLTRDFIETLKENIGACKEEQAVWEDREEAFDWLAENIGEAMDDDVKWEQDFSQGDRAFLVNLKAESVDDKGEQESFEYLFDLNDINPLKINLEVSGRSLSVEVPVREGENFIEVTTQEGTEYTDELVIYADDIEIARQIVNALSYVVSNTMPERPEWGSYSEALEFVKENMGEVQVDDEIYNNSIEFESSPSGIVDMTIKETDDDGETEKTMYSFYPADITDKLALDVSRDEIIVKMETKNERDFIRETTGESVSGYESDLEFHVGSIDLARDIINAFEHAIRNSIEAVKDFSTVDEINFWMADNFPTLYREDEKYEQSLEVMKDNENQIVFNKVLTETDDGEVTESKYIIYPEDISLENLEIDVSGGRLTVALETDKDDFIKYYENGMLDDFTDEAEVYFFDPLVAKNFMAAIRFLKDNSMVEDRTEMSKEEAISFLTGNIQNLEMEEEKYEQSLEVEDEGNCSMSFTRVETDDDGEVTEYIYEFVASDLHRGNSELSVSSDLIEITLVTAGNEELIKPYENGQVEDFEDEFTVYADDVLLAKKIMAAFAALSMGCK